MATLQGSLALTVMVMVFEAAGFPVRQFAFDKSLQVITSPFTGLE
jgi:hypothetical protein